MTKYKELQEYLKLNQHTWLVIGVAGFIGSPAMNFLDCKLERNSENLEVKLGGMSTLQVPADRGSRYEPCVGRGLVFGIRPEHVHEKRAGEDAFAEVMVNFIEPLGMETMVYFTINGVELCGRVSPEADPRPGQTISLTIDIGKMHLIDSETNLVL